MATAGAIGAVVALSCTYPLSVVKARLQAQRRWRDAPRKKTAGVGIAGVPKPYKGALHCLYRVAREEGMSGLYSGMYGALVKAAGTNWVFYFFFSLLERFFLRNAKRGKQKTALMSLLHGISAGILVQLVMLPIDLVVTRTQVSRNDSGRNFLKVLRSVIESPRGIRSLWSGIGPGLVLTLNPGITTLVRNKLDILGATWQVSTSAKNFWIGLVSKSIASSMTYPYVVCKVQMQVASEAGEAGEKPTMLQTFTALMGSGGALALYQGLIPQLLNAVLKEAILNSVRLEIVAAVGKVAKTLSRQ